MNNERLVKVWQAARRMLIAAVVGLIIGGAIWFHEAKGAVPPPSSTAKAKLANS